ncbi:MAG: tetratricopeptide repeat protein [Dehalococcoidia bacterium]
MTAIATQEDRYGLPLTTVSADAANAYRLGQERTLSHAPDPYVPLEQAIAADPEFALAHAALALGRLRELRLPEAKAEAETAVRFAASASRRERQHADAVLDAVSGRGAQAIERMREHLREFPRDAVLLNYATTSLLFAGRQDEMVEVTEPAALAYPADDWFFLGLHSFALEEVRRFGEARTAAELALDRYPLAAFATHGLAHVFYETGANEEGNAFMPGWLASYDVRGGMHLHLSWHYALFLLADAEYERVFELYDRHIRPSARPGDFQLFDPVSLLWRTDAYSGRSRPELWDELGPLAAERAAQPGMIFADLHHGMALAATGRQAELDRLLDSFRNRGARGNVTAGEVALPLLQGMCAFAAGDYEAAVQLIEPIDDRIYLVGGSKAQREVFHDTLLESLLRSGRFEAAEAKLRERLDRRSSPRDFYRLARVQAEATDHAAALPNIEQTVSAWAAADQSNPEVAAARGLYAAVGG